MKILHIIDSLALGGAQAIVKGILECYIDKDYFLYALRKTHITIGIKHPKVYVLNSNKKYTLRPLKELDEIICKEKIEVLHCHLFRSQFFGWLLKRRKYADIKLVFHEHGRIFNNSFIYKLFLKYSMPQVNLYLAVSAATKRRLIRSAKIPDSKIKILYNFVDTHKYNRANISWNRIEERRMLGINRDEFVVGFAGRLVEGKGWRVFIDAAEIILKRYPNIRFLIAGDGEDKAKLKHLVLNKNLNNKVVFIGYVSDMVWYYSLLSCFVIPSQWESMGLTEIEAQAMGIPVISSNVEALNEVIKDGENGLLFEANNHKDLAKKIIRLYQCRSIRKKLINGGYSTVNKYNLKEYLVSLETHYKSLTN